MTSEQGLEAITQAKEYLWSLGFRMLCEPITPVHHENYDDELEI